MYQIAASILKSVVIVLLSQAALESIRLAIKRNRAKARAVDDSTAGKAGAQV